MDCQAKRTNGEPCKARAVNGRRVCRAHGGLTPQPGPTHPNWKHGRRSKYIPARLADKYAESLADPQLTEFRQDIALLESRLYELLETGESEPLWAKAQDAFRELRQAMAAQDGAGITYSLGALDSLINRGTADALRWAEVYRVTEQMGKTKEREFKRLQAAQQMMTTEEVLGMLGMLASVIRENVSNPAEVAAVNRAIARLGVVETGRNDSAGH